MRKFGAAVLLAVSLVITAWQYSQAQEPICIITVDPRILYFEGEGGRQEVTVTPSAPGCSFAPRTAYGWIKAYSSEEFGKRTVVIEADPAPNFAQRLGAVMVGTTQIEIVQRPRYQFNW
jgi:hypothetical protein